MKTGLERITTKAQLDKKCKFTSLAHHLSPELLWKELKVQCKSKATGVDDQSVQAATESFSDWSEELLNAVHRQGYKAPAIRRTYIPKPGKEEKRPLKV